MKKNFTLCFFLFPFLTATFPTNAFAQCPAGYTQSQLNWDNLDFLPSNNTRYTSFYPSPSFPYSQNFAMGTRRVNFEMAPQGNITLDGENGTNTAHTGSFAGAGDDVQFTTTSANATITISFDADVANIQFSLFDLDNSQRINITATDGGGALQTITMTRASATSGISITGSGSASATATGPGGGYNNADNRGTLNVEISGPVSQIIITLSNAAGNIWLSDINACVTGSLPVNYQQISQPFTGQPQYVLTVVNNNVYYTDPTNGRAYFLFNEPGHDRLNSMAYDPYRRIVYYTYSLTDRAGLVPQNDKTLKKYDVDAKVISVVIADVNTFGIPTYESGVESGAATFYNGSLYLGIEGYTGTTGSSAYAAGRKSTIWKIDFDASGNPVAPATQVFGVTSDDGVNAQNIHDWSDFGISNGVLYDFDGSQSGGIDFYHFDMMTGVTTNYAPVGVIPRQVSIGWDENLYNVDASISLYNGTNGVGTLHTIFAPLGPVIPVGSSASWGDAAGPYRPFLDFGDAPASYDPDPLSPACHDTLTPNVAGKRTQMRLGPAEDVEWLKRGFTTVEDNYEDGLAFVPLFSPTSGTYFAQVSVFNNTGANATVCAWLDFNGNGFFDAGEGITPITVSSSAFTQSIGLSWPSTPTSLPNGATTYLRIRITSAAYNMTAANSTGYYDMGEVEDYRVFVDGIVLSLPLAAFEARVADNSRVRLNWSVSEDPDFAGYQVQRSRNGRDWEYVMFVPASQQNGIHQYDLADNNPYPGLSSYRLVLMETSGRLRYSNIRSVKISNLAAMVSLFPNPAFDRTTVMITGDFLNRTAGISITNENGIIVASNKAILNNGNNAIEIALDPAWPRGIYLVTIRVDGHVATKKLLLQKNYK